MYEITKGCFIKSKDTEKQFEVVDITPNHIRLKDSFTEQEIELTVGEVNEQIFLGNYDIGTFDVREKKIKFSDAKDFTTLPEKLKTKAAYRFAYVKAVYDANISKYSPKTLEPVISKVSQKNGSKRPSWRTLVRWLERYEANNIIGLVDNHDGRGNRSSRVSQESEQCIAEAIEFYKTKAHTAKASAYRRLRDRILLENAQRSPSEKLELISYVSFVKRLNAISEYELLNSRGYKHAAKVRYKQLKENAAKYTATKILDRAEIDHTVLDVFVVAEKKIGRETHHIPLGRPRITMIIDWFSKCVLGYSISFRDPSYLSIAEAIKCAISDKKALLDKYPSVEGEWYCRGKFQSLVFDRGRDFRSSMLRDTLQELRISGSANKGGYPWNKGTVESFFKTLNQDLLQDFPGMTPVKIDENLEFNPQKNAVITLSTLREVVIKWIVDVYHREPLAENKPSPNHLWLESAKEANITPVPVDKLDVLLSETHMAKNGPHGIQYQYIKYDSPELVLMRKRDGYAKVIIKINWADLGEIKVLDAKKGRYVTVPSVDYEYAKGLSMAQHKRLRSVTKKLVGLGVPYEDIARSKVDIFKIAIERMNASETVKNKHRTAILLGFGDKISKAPVSGPLKEKKSADTEREVKESLDIDINKFSDIEDDIPDDFET